MLYWDGKRLRQRARAVLKGHYLEMFFVSLVCSLVTGALRMTLEIRNGIKIRELINGDWYLPYAIRQLLPSLTFTTVAVGLAGICWRLFISNPLEVGESRYFTLCRYGEYDWENTLFAYRSGKYRHIVGTMVVRDIKILLWGLLFIIPGIIKSYEYFMVPYIMAENPRMDRARAFEISSAVTRGDKWRMFALDLGFFALYLLLAVLTLGVGIVFLMPYHKAARAELYGGLRYKGAKTGAFTASELGAELFN